MAGNVGLLRRLRSPQLYAVPAMLYLTVLTIFPMAYAVYVSLLHYSLLSGTTHPVFAGLSNYIAAFTDPRFQQSLGLTFAWGAAITVVEIVVGLGVALVLNQEGRLASFVRGSMMMPLCMTPFVILMMWRFLLDPAEGPVSYLVGILTGNPNVALFSGVPQVWVTFAVMDIWEFLPFVVVIIVAGLSSIPRPPLEAANLDGATGWTLLRNIILPYLKPTLAVVVLFRLIDSFRSFEIVYLFTGGGPGNATNFMSWDIFETGLGIVENIGLSSAYTIIFLVCVLAIAWGLMYYLYRLRG